MARATLIDFFEDFAALSKTFLVHDDGLRTRRYSYRQVAGAARNFAARLRAAGIAPADRIVIWAENRPEWVAAFWGSVLAGVVVVPIDYRASRAMCDRVASIVCARAVLAGDEVERRPGDWKMSGFDWTAGEFQSVGAQPSDLCEIVFTSGATADPKGVRITHANILANIVPVEQEIRKFRLLAVPFAPIRFLNLLPLSHMFGQAMATFIPPVLPGEVVFIGGLNPREVVTQIRSRRISVLVCVPKILDVLREYVVALEPGASGPAPAGNWARRWWHFRRVHNRFGWKFWCFIAGAAPLGEELEAFWSKLGFLVVQGYGLTETAPIVTLNHPFHTSGGSVGKAIAGVEIKLAGDGEILVRGANVSSAYVDESGEQPVLEDGWFHTGDIGSIGADGSVFIRGRKKELIVTAEGMNVFPEDVERVLNAVPGVLESAVIGAGDGGGEQVYGVVVLKPGASLSQVTRMANERLEPHQQLRGISEWPDRKLPRTEGTQKLKRVAIRDWINGSSHRPAATTADDGLLARYADETPLSELGLTSLDRVELAIKAERNAAGAIDEASFLQARTVGELRRLSEKAATQAGSIAFPRWNRCAPLRWLRRSALALVLLPLLRVFVWLRVSGKGRLRELREPVLFTANHQSVLDVPTILAAMPRNVRYRVATAMGMDWFQPHFHPENFPWYLRIGNHLQYVLASLLFNTFPIPQREAGTREALRYAGELVSEGDSILIFPEGVRTTKGEIAAFRPGAGMMASRLNLAIVPVRIDGLERVLRTGRHFPRPGRVRVSFGEPLAPEDGNYEEISKRAESAVRALPGVNEPE